MKHVAQFVRSKTARLALSYLAVLMLLSIGFSAALYNISVDQFKVELETPGIQTGAHTNGASTYVVGQESMLGKSSTDSKHIVSSSAAPELSSLNRQLQQRVASIRSNLVKRLVILNVLVPLLGASLSYYLARRTLKPIEAAAEAQSRFASDASHELRTPLAVMRSENESALRLLKLPKQARAVLQSNLEEIARLKELSEGLLRLARDTEVLPVKPVRIDEVAAQARDGVSKLAVAEEIAIDMTIPHAYALADAASLTQVLTILLDNAIKYSSRNSTINIEGYGEGKHVYIDVSDEGAGIAAAELAHVFDRFYRSESARLQHATGHGLGLSIAKRLIERQHGTISVKSELGKGSTFTIKLPVSKNK